MTRTTWLRFLGVAVPALAAATLAISVLQDGLGVRTHRRSISSRSWPPPSSSGPAAPSLAALASFLLYDFLFVPSALQLHRRQPRASRRTCSCCSSLGSSSGSSPHGSDARAEVADRREREARALFASAGTRHARNDSRRSSPEIAAILRRGDRDGSASVVSLGHDQRTGAWSRDAVGRAAPGVQPTTFRTSSDAG